MDPRSEKSPSHEQCRQRLDAIIDNNGIATAVLASIDGEVLATASHSPAINPTHIASLSAMTAALGKPPAASNNTCRTVCISDLDGSPMVTLAIGPTLLTVIGRDGANMGMVVGIARDAGQQMGACIDSLRQRQRQESGFIFDAEGLTRRVLAAIAERNNHFQEGST